eukprot:TRINITY_DN11830_c3_g2_i2.p1 TRINITY_DN11830_c3_g2~~TRINITY_DN11830_c3_g2_i2.p1  ORF type:complete len:802 (+),score=134.95 TRINITY_DN11830_c3_g2_i2:325-2730(+)
MSRASYQIRVTTYLVLLFAACTQPDDSLGYDDNLMVDIESFKLNRKDEVKSMFYHGYNGYMSHAFPRDELKPLSCDGYDTWGPFALTLVDALDTLYVLGNLSAFKHGVAVTIDTLNLNIDKNVSVFETTIRVLGGLISSHILADELQQSAPKHKWYHGELLQLATDLGVRLLPAFDTITGIPYGTVNLRHGIPPGETPVSSLAAAGTHLLEMGMLSRLTGRPEFLRVAKGAMRALWSLRSAHDLVGNHIDTATGKWTLKDAGIGPNQDSFYEYLVKGYILLDDEEYLEMFEPMYVAINRHMKQGDWYMDVNMDSAAISLPWFTALSGFWPGLQVLYGDVVAGQRSMLAFQQIWRRFGFAPEAFNLKDGTFPHQLVGYFLRPELAESLMYLYRATKDPIWLFIGDEMIRSIQTVTKTSCGYAIVTNVSSHTLGDRMESFFLSETLKYLYLLYDEENFVHKGNFVFNTEAHYYPVQAASVASVAQPSNLTKHACERQPKSMRMLGHGLVNPPAESMPTPVDPHANPAPTPASQSTTLSPEQLSALQKHVQDMLRQEDPKATLSVARAELQKHQGNDQLLQAFESLVQVHNAQAPATRQRDATETVHGRKEQDTDPSDENIEAREPINAEIRHQSTSPVEPDDESKGTVKPAPSPPSKPRPPLAERLSTFKSSCFTSQHDYWHYEVCVGRSVRQYHQEKGKIVAQNWLGHRDVANDIRDATTLSQVQRIMDGIDKQAVLNDDRPIELTQTFMKGSLCGSVAVKRSASVQYACLHNDNIKAVQMTIAEPQACMYRIEIATPLLCR